ncbi:hypothetical protein GJ698_09980 [Pseudoduganella sp. FT26W]|uniref:DUF1640 domain-containing protein n=1 Tax=Duganella aquatilis TaxID=2666082 RepID=A0A844DB50_9BURK|nr:hypothetical protein [Duganella aquatilis]MRW84414.1 hypothetical protein [Duganella aquatilis]
MNMPIKFDTLEYTRSLIEAGIPAPQAEAQAAALSQAMAEATVAPSELVLLRTDMTARIEMLRIEMNEKFDALRAEMNAKLEALEEQFNSKLEALEERFNAKLEALEGRFNAKLEALEQRLRAYIDRKLVTVYWMVGISLALHAVTIGMLVRVIDRLP